MVFAVPSDLTTAPRASVFAPFYSESRIMFRSLLGRGKKIPAVRPINKFFKKTRMNFETLEERTVPTGTSACTRFRIAATCALYGVIMSTSFGAIGCSFPL